MEGDETAENTERPVVGDQIPVLTEGNGQVFWVPTGEPRHGDRLGSLKVYLSSQTGIQPEDQILLIGPPYRELRRLDPQLLRPPSAAADKGEAGAGAGGVARSIYLYNRRTLDENSPVSEETGLRLALPELPTEAEPAPAELQCVLLEGGGPPSSPLLQALSQYERLVSLNLAKGQAYVERGRRVLEACQLCLEEQERQRDAGEAALEEVAGRCERFRQVIAEIVLRPHQQVQERSRALLDNFEANLARLESRQLHPALREAVSQAVACNPRARKAADRCNAGSKVGQQGTMTLLDCVPSNMRSWCADASRACRNLHQLVSQLEGAVVGLGEGVSVQQEGRLPVDLPLLCEEVDGGLKRLLAEQEKGLVTLERAHREAVDRIVAALQQQGSSSRESAVSACQWLEALLDRQAGVMAALEAVDHDMLSRARTLANHKTQTLRWLVARLEGAEQLRLQVKALEGNLGLYKRFVPSAWEHVEPLAWLERLPEAHEGLLAEVRRRQLYGRLLHRVVRRVMDGLAGLRDGERAARFGFHAQWAVLERVATLLSWAVDPNARPPQVDVMTSATPEPNLPALRGQDAEEEEEEEEEEADSEAQLLQQYLAMCPAAAVDLVNRAVPLATDAAVGAGEAGAKRDSMRYAQLERQLTALKEHNERLQQEVASARGIAEKERRCLRTENEQLRTAQAKEGASHRQEVQQLRNELQATKTQLLLARQQQQADEATRQRGERKAEGGFVPGRTASPTATELARLRRELAAAKAAAEKEREQRRSEAQAWQDLLASLPQAAADLPPSSSPGSPSPSDRSAASSSRGSSPARGVVGPWRPPASLCCHPGGSQATVTGGGGGAHAVTGGKPAAEEEVVEQPGVAAGMGEPVATTTTGGPSSAAALDPPMEGSSSGRRRKMLAYDSFQEGDLALFCPWRPPGRDGNRTKSPSPSSSSPVLFAAFHSGCPHHFLTHQSLIKLAAAKGKGRDQIRELKFVVGKVVSVDRGVAREGVAGVPAGLSPGMGYAWLQCEPV